MPPIWREAKSLREEALDYTLQVANFGLLAEGPQYRDIQSRNILYSRKCSLSFEKSLRKTPVLRQNGHPHTPFCTTLDPPPVVPRRPGEAGEPRGLGVTLGLFFLPISFPSGLCWYGELNNVEKMDVAKLCLESPCSASLQGIYFWSLGLRPKIR